MKLWNWMKDFFRKETVLSIALILAVLSAFLIKPDREYIGYVDFRTLAILFCLMAVMAGVRLIGGFDYLAQLLLKRVSRLWQLILVLVMFCFFFSMVITNDVALITFVPLTIITLGMLGDKMKKRYLIPVVVMQTVAANLGSMLTPIGNPQNLYLFGISGMDIPEFIGLMLPYSVLAFGLLFLWSVFAPKLTAKKESSKQDTSAGEFKVSFENPAKITDAKKLIMYFILFMISLLTVARVIPYYIVLAIVFVCVVMFDRKVLPCIDYSLLGTFVGFFIFIGNMGRYPAFNRFLHRIIEGHETITAVVASQVMSNVPAALLLSGFTDRYDCLIVGTNLGGLGTLIASMASLISFKYIAKEDRALRGKYFLYFTVVNTIFLFLMILLMLYLK